MDGKDVLHEVNNQLEIVIGTTRSISTQSEDERSRECRALIESAVYKMSAQLNSYFKTLIAAEMEQGGNSHPQSRARKQVVKPRRSPETPSRTQS